MQQLMVEYDSLRPSIRELRDWYQRSFNGMDPIKAFAEGIARNEPNDARKLDEHRFRVSRFFVKIRKLTLANYLPEEIIVAALHRQAIRTFLDRVSPLDATLRRSSLPDPDETFYRSLLERRYQPQDSQSYVGDSPSGEVTT